VFRASACKTKLNQAQYLVIKHLVPLQKFINGFRRKKISALYKPKKKYVDYYEIM